MSRHRFGSSVLQMRPSPAYHRAVVYKSLDDFARDEAPGEHVVPGEGGWCGLTLFLIREIGATLIGVDRLGEGGELLGRWLTLCGYLDAVRYPINSRERGIALRVVRPAELARLIALAQLQETPLANLLMEEYDRAHPDD